MNQSIINGVQPWKMFLFYYFLVPFNVVPNWFSLPPPWSSCSSCGGRRYGKNDYFSSIIPIVLKTPKKTMKKEEVTTKKFKILI